jgi:hypothetical protein
MYSRISDYDDYSTAYAAYVAQREHGGVEGNPFGILPCLLEFLGDVTERSIPVTPTPRASIHAMSRPVPRPTSRRAASGPTSARNCEAMAASSSGMAALRWA